MKTINYVLGLIMLLSSNAIIAQQLEINTKKSTIDWHGEKVVGEHEGTIQIKSGYIELKNDQIVAGNFVVDMATITNTDLEDQEYNQKLVGHLKSDDFFGVEKYPTANFVITKSTKFNDRKATVTGDITIKGKTESISFEVSRAGKEYTAKIDIDRSKFDVRYGSDSFFDNLGDKVIYDIFTLNIKLVVN